MQGFINHLGSSLLIKMALTECKANKLQLLILPAGDDQSTQAWPLSLPLLLVRVEVIEVDSGEAKRFMQKAAVGTEQGVKACIQSESSLGPL